MEKDTARELLTSLHDASFIVRKTLVDGKGTYPEGQFDACAHLVGHLMTDMFDTVMVPIYNQHQDLAPEWYSPGVPLGRETIAEITAPPEVREALLRAFETAYERVQAALNQVSNLPDPDDVALYSLGLHEISVRICRARLSLLRAKTD